MQEESKIQKLVMEAAKGSGESFGQLYDLFAPRIFNFIVGRVRHKGTAEDLLHTVFLKAWNSIPRYRPKKSAKFSTWLFQIANYTIIDYWRTKKDFYEIDKFENLASLATDPVLYEHYGYLWKAVGELPDDYRTVINLRFVQDLSISETAAAMNKSQVGVRVLQHRAVKQLKAILKKHGHDSV
jgi:RNA polymerase sigma-70 factor (ECF subfamily)